MTAPPVTVVTTIGTTLELFDLMQVLRKMIPANDRGWHMMEIQIALCQPDGPDGAMLEDALTIYINRHLVAHHHAI